MKRKRTEVKKKEERSEKIQNVDRKIGKVKKMNRKKSNKKKESEMKISEKK